MSPRITSADLVELQRRQLAGGTKRCVDCAKWSGRQCRKRDGLRYGSDPVCREFESKPAGGNHVPDAGKMAGADVSQAVHEIKPERAREIQLKSAEARKANAAKKEPTL